MEESAGIVSFKPAVRKGSHVLIALEGESGSGKTLSALLLARGLVGSKGKIGVLDTETERALTYADDARIGEWTHADLTYPYTPERYVQSLREAEKAGLDVLIIDSGSHEWEGIGGVIEIAEEPNGAGKVNDGLVKWARPKFRHKKFVQALLTTRMHIIVCLRAKEKMVQQVNPETKKKEIVSAGFIPVQDKRFAYEMTVRLFLSNADGSDEKGRITVKKCPDKLLPAFPEGQRVTIKSGEMVKAWVDGGAPVDTKLHDLRRTATEAAENGTTALMAWHKSAQQADKEAVARMWADHGANLKSVAAEADKEASEESEAGKTTNPFFKKAAAAPAEAQQEGDFGLPPIAGGKPGTAPSPSGKPKPAPYAIGLQMQDGKVDYMAWAADFDQAIRSAISLPELDSWLALNDAALRRCAQGDESIHAMLISAIKTRREALQPRALL